jgi:NAD(P)-dependent dehydrogenase (short-subunit alcohol dehydrogenase family)
MLSNQTSVLRDTIWSALKTWRKLRMGPLSLVYKFERAVPVSRNRVKRSNTDRRRSGAGELENTVHQDAQQANTRRDRGVAVIVGVGPGFGYALAHRLSDDGFEVILVSRNVIRLSSLVDAIELRGGKAIAYSCDATLETSVINLFSLLRQNHETPSLVVYSIQSFGPGAGIDVKVDAFEDGWKHNCLGSFLVARSAAREMLQKSKGTIILVGSTSSLIGRDGHLNLAVGKFGQRALAQVLARELWPKGIHVAHLVIDADIQDDLTPADDEAHSDPNHIAETVLHLHNQPKSAWTSEIDLRPWNEKFWEHC